MKKVLFWISLLVIILFLFLFLFSSPHHAQNDKLLDSFLSRALDGDLKTIKALIDTGINVNWVSKNFWCGTALNCAAVNCKLEVVEILIASGANVNISNKDGWTPLHYASREGGRCTQLIDILLKNGADINVRNKDGVTPLAMAASYGQSENIKLIVSRGILKPGAESGSSVDRILLKNGDVITGQLLTSSFTIRTSYSGSITFNCSEIKLICVEGGGHNIDTILLRNGDKLSGVVSQENVSIRTADGEKTEFKIRKDKIKEINLK